MTENRIFELTLKETKVANLTWPKLNKEACDIICDKFTQVIYDTLKEKSSTSVTKRTNILKLLNNFCSISDAHRIDTSKKEHFQSVAYSCSKSSDFECFIKQIHNEINQSECNNITKQIIEYNGKKNYKHRTKKREFIKNHDQKLVDLHFKYPVALQRKIHYYETEQSFIKSLLGEAMSGDEHCRDSREHLKNKIKFTYAAINLKVHNYENILLDVLSMLKNYTSLEKWEEELITYAFQFCDNPKIMIYLAENFPFVFEKIIIQLCKEIILCENEEYILEYFKKLEDHSLFNKLRDLCLENIEFHCKVKNIIYHLYFYSNCNENLLSLINLF